MWLGEFDLSAVVNFKFTSRGSTGLPTTLSGTPAVSVYKSNSTTESTTGVTLTVDFDARTGCNHVNIDTSTDGTFYATATDFQVVITAGTVGGVSVVGEVVGHFAIRNRAPLKPATAGRTLVVDAAGLADANMVKVGPTGSGTAQTAKDIGGAVPAVAAGAANGLVINGSNTGPLSVSGGVTFTNSGGDGFVCSSSGSNGNGINASGNGSGSAIKGSAGATGRAIYAIGGSSSGAGLRVEGGGGNSNAIEAFGSGTSDGISATGGATGRGIHATGGNISGAGIRGEAAAGNSLGIHAVGFGSGPGIQSDGGSTGQGMLINGGAASGDGIGIITVSGHGINIAPVGSSKHGIFSTGGNGGTSDGIKAVAGTGGVDIRGNIAGNVTGNLSGSIGSYTGNTPQTGDAYARLGAPAGASVSADISSVKTDTGTTIPGRLPSSLSPNGNMKADIEELAGNTGGAAGLDRAARSITTGTVGTGSTTTSLVTSVLSPSATVNSQFKGLVVKFDKTTTTAALRGQAAVINDSTSGGVFDLTGSALTTAPVSGDTFTVQ